MKPLTRYGIPVVLAAAIASAILIWGILSRVRNEENAVGQHITEKMKTVCVGRFLIDLPANADVEFPPARVGSIVTNVLPDYSEEKLKAEIAKHEQELAEQKNEYDKPSFEKKVEVDALNFKATVIYYGREKPLDSVEYGKKMTGTDEALSVEAFGLHDGRVYHFKGEHVGVPENEDVVLKLIQRTEARSTDSIPEKSGFCVENALLHDPLPVDNNETVTMFASIPGHPDVAIRLNTMTAWRTIPESILARDAANRVKKLAPHRFKNLRRGNRTLAGMEGAEILDKIKEENGTSGHMLMWFGPGKMKDASTPIFSLELTEVYCQ